MPSDIDAVVTTSQLAAVLGLSDRRVRQLAQESIIARLGDESGKKVDGKFLLAACVQAYIEYIKDSASDSEIATNRENAKLRREIAQAEEAEIKVDILKSTVHRSEDVEAVLNDMHTALKTRALSLPAKLSRQLAEETDIAKVSDIIETEVHALLQESKTYSWDEFEQRNREFVRSHELFEQKDNEEQQREKE